MVKSLYSRIKVLAASTTAELCKLEQLTTTLSFCILNLIIVITVVSISWVAVEFNEVICKLQRAVPDKYEVPIGSCLYVCIE